MLERVLGQLAPYGIDEAVLSLGYLPDAFLQAYPQGSVAGVKLHYAVEEEPLDTGGAIRFAAEAAGCEETFVVVNGDVLTDLDLSRLVAFHRARGARATLRLYPVADPSAFGVVTTDWEGRVTAFVEKPPADTAPTNLINAGTYVFEPDVLDLIPSGRRVSIERETFPVLAARGELFAMEDDAYWLDTGSPTDYLQANQDLLTGRRRCAPSPLADRLRDDLWVHGHPRIDGETERACFVGDGAQICAGARVSGSVIGARAIVERGAIVDGSVVFSGASICSGATVVGSIVGGDAVIGPGSVVRSLSVIGFGAHVGAGEMVDGERRPA